MHSQVNTLHESVVRTLVVPCQDLTGCNATFATAYSCRKNIPDIFTPSGFSSRSVGRRHLTQFTYATLYLLGTTRNTRCVTHLIILLYAVQSIMNRQIFLTLGCNKDIGCTWSC